MTNGKENQAVTEEETFNTLRRIPFPQLLSEYRLEKWPERQSNEEFFSSRGWSYVEFRDAWMGNFYDKII